ncbi:MAG TPA: DUF4372 domain-containing protein, partial [Magnetospirillum sp.]|nr:DUF4372 domain-containing protein [Magnetospirillum sp.]
MRHHNSVFRDLLDNLPWAVLDRLVTVHRADHRVRSLTTRHQLVALLYGQFSGAASLREIEGGLESHAARLYHVGGRTVSRSTFADAHAERPIYAAVSAANINDITAAHAMPVEAGATYVFDLGYYDYGW